MSKKTFLPFATIAALALALSGCGNSAPESEAAPSAAEAPTSEAVSRQTAEPKTTTAPSEPDNDATNASDTDAGGSASEALFVDGVLTTPELKIVITEHKVIPAGEEGNEYGDTPVIAFWYETTNLTDADVSPMDFIFYFEAYQDNNPNAENTLEVAGLPDDRFLDTQTETIKKDGTVENAMAYELDDETTPVDLVASDFITEFGTTTYDLP